MIIQKLVLPHEASFEDDMYVRRNRQHVALIREEQMLVSTSTYEQIRFDTYFNTFSRKKWHKYTNLDNLKLQLEIEGSARVSLTKLELHGNDIDEYIVNSTIVHHDTRKTITLDYPAYANEDALAFYIYPLSEKLCLYSGAYVSDVDENELPEIRLALGICTYRREDYIARNMRTLRNDVFENPDSPLRENVKVYISDNGNTLNAADFDPAHIELMPNKNSGGSGGFSRAAIEALNDESFRPTHVIFMDDDIQFEADSLERNYVFLRLLKPEYHISMLGGAMFRTDRRYIQHAAGETHTLDGITFNKAGYNMYNIQDVLRNEVEERINYLGWWYCCIPRELFEKVQFSLPLFVQYDDIEFSLRNKDVPKITLNGICCWHLPFDKKWSGFKNYYTIRNRSIVNCICFDDFTKERFLKDVTKTTMRSLFQFSYNEANLALLAAEDFLKGMSWLRKQDPVELNKKVIGLSDKLADTSTLSVPYDPRQLRRNYDYRKTDASPIVRYGTLNGWLLPSNRNVTVELDPPIRFLFRAKKAVKYDINTGKAIVAEKDYAKAEQVLARLAKLYAETNKKYDDVVREYRTMRSDVITEEFWRKFLNF